LRKTDIKSKATLFDIVDDLTWLKRTGVMGKNYVYEFFDMRNVAKRYLELFESL
jgi:hypothetical protein